MALTPGTRIGPYEILAALGAGGMGEVYRARDQKLGRDVAIKVLPAMFTADVERLARFEREARVLASLNHAQIGAIYGFEESGGMRALVLELVEGPTLAERIERGPIPLGEAIAFARQIADALDAAHERGIVHRDLKPANVKVTPGGTVKVLDFGLAKAPIDDGGAAGLTRSPTITIENTRHGTVLGTAAYMSPEQARGQSVDRRTDVWAFGCVFYEMLTGRLAFPAATLSDTIVSVLEREPDWLALPPATPSHIRRLLQRCLVKDPKRRLRDIGDARLELETTSDEHQTPATPTTRRPGWRVPVAAGAAAVLAGLLGWGLGSGRSAPLENPLSNARFTRLTDFEGVDRDAAISPDGKFVAFLSNRDGPFDILVTQVGSGRFNNLTQGKESNLDAALPIVGFTADGADVWFHDADLMSPLRTLPLMGGPPRVFLGKSPVKTPPMNAIWSPDVTQLVYHTSDPGDPMFVADRTGANPRLVLPAETAGIHHHWPAWSPDGRWIYFSRGNPLTNEFDLYRIPAPGGPAQRITQHNNYVASPAPIGPNTVLYVARERDDSGPWLWALDTDRNLTRRVSFGLEQYTSVKASADGQRLVATVANPTASLWTVPILDRVAEERDASHLALPTVRALAPRFGAKELFYLSSLGTGDGLWRVDNGQAVEVWKGSDGALLAPASFSADGRRAAFALRKEGRLQLHLLSSNGADLQPIGGAFDVQGATSWSPDGKWIAAGGQTKDGQGLFKVPVEGGNVVRLVSGTAVNPVWSPDGALIVYTGPNVGREAPLVAVRPDGTKVEIPAISVRRDGRRTRFLPNGKGLVYMQGFLASQDFWLLDLDTRQRRRLTHLTDSSAMLTFDVAPDGKSIVFDRLRENSDIVVIDLQR